tara:strand:- start:10697 stop:12553 length:1857 start_codon:yes stop_codon:yes gene_type:complete
MANSILVRGARDVGRAKITDPYKFSAWIRSMFYGLDKLGDRAYNIKMSQIAAASKLRSDQMKQIENTNKLNREDMKRYHEKYNDVGILPAHLSDVGDQIGSMYQNFVQATGTKSTSNPLSPDFSIATNIQDGVLKTFTEWKGLFNDYQGLADQLREAMNPDNDDLSRAHDWDRALFYNMILPDNHRIRFVQNDAGKEDIAFIFDNPYDEEIASVSKYRVTDPDTNEEVYGILLSDFIADHGGFFLKNKGRDADIEADWKKMEGDVISGKSNYMYFTDKQGIKQKFTRDEFISMYPWRNTFTKEKTITTADGTTMTVNRNVRTNLQAMAFDYDPDGSAYGQTTFAESAEAMLIQNYYIEWLAERDDLSKDQVLAMMNSGDQNFMGKPFWILDDDFAFGDIDIPNLYGENFSGNNLLEHAMHIHYGGGAYDALEGAANNFINSEAKKERDRIAKGLKNTGRGGTGGKGKDEVIFVPTESLDIMGAAFSNFDDYSMGYNQDADHANRTTQLKELERDVTYQGSKRPMYIFPKTKDGQAVHYEYDIWIGMYDRSSGEYVPRKLGSSYSFDVRKPSTTKKLWGLLFDGKKNIDTFPDEVKEFINQPDYKYKVLRSDDVGKLIK